MHISGEFDLNNRCTEIQIYVSSIPDLYRAVYTARDNLICSALGPCDRPDAVFVCCTINGDTRLPLSLLNAKQVILNIIRKKPEPLEWGRISLNTYVNASFLNATIETCIENRSNFEYERGVHTIFDCLRDRILLEGGERGDQYTGG